MRCGVSEEVLLGFVFIGLGLVAGAVDARTRAALYPVDLY